MQTYKYGEKQQKKKNKEKKQRTSVDYISLTMLLHAIIQYYTHHYYNILAWYWLKIEHVIISTLANAPVWARWQWSCRNFVTTVVKETQNAEAIEDD